MKHNHNAVTAAHTTKVIPEDVISLFGDPPLVGGEDRGLYDHLRCRVALAVDPQNFIEWLYIKDIVDLDWEIRRYRYMQSIVLNAKVAELIDRRITFTEATRMMDENAKVKSPFDIAQALRTQTRDEIASRLKNDYDIDFDANIARAFTLCRKEIEGLERMLASAESRRNTVLRDITLHRNMGSFAKRLGEASSKLVGSMEHDGTALLDHQKVDGQLVDSHDVSVVP